MAVAALYLIGRRCCPQIKACGWTTRGKLVSRRKQVRFARVDSGTLSVPLFFAQVESSISTSSSSDWPTNQLFPSSSSSLPTESFSCSFAPSLVPIYLESSFVRSPLRPSVHPPTAPRMKMRPRSLAPLLGRKRRQDRKNGLGLGETWKKARIALLGDFALDYNYHPKGGRPQRLPFPCSLPRPSARSPVSRWFDLACVDVIKRFFALWPARSFDVRSR